MQRDEAGGPHPASVAALFEADDPDLVTAEDARSRGHGLALMKHVEDLARDEGCETLGLSSALHRVDAHRFYLDKVGMDKVSYTFTKKL